MEDFFKPKNLKSRQEKIEREDEILCQQKFGMSTSKLKEIYFHFFDQLTYPYKIELKKHLPTTSILCDDIPKTIFDALYFGFGILGIPDELQFLE